MQKPDYLRPTQYYVIGCTKPDEQYKDKNVIHFSRLQRGRNILADQHKFEWEPEDRAWKEFNPTLKKILKNHDLMEKVKAKAKRMKKLEQQAKEKKIEESKEYEKNLRRRKPRGGRRGGGKTQPRRGKKGRKQKEE